MTTLHTVRLNGADQEVAAGTTLLDLVAGLTGHDLRADGSRADGGRLGVAAAVGGAVAPRGRRGARDLAGGEQIEIVTAVQGG